MAIGLLSAIGAVEWFHNPEKLVSYFGLNPSVYQSGPAPARRGSHHQARTFVRGRIARRESLGRSTGASPLACFLPAHTRPSRPPDRDCRDGTQTGGHGVVCAHAQ
ncbi:transposase [Paraburkholderia sediminicola]|uniref:Transposase n=1 Tax=Paraburkholderia rhynchosiae TaxID=487049 RepID=A0ACC7NJH5_9BURK